MCGTSIVGFGLQTYVIADGRSHEWMAVGLAPRKAALTLYRLVGSEVNDDLLERLGPHTTGKDCLHLKRFDAIDHEVFTEMVRRSWATNND
jgi:hypothetical protein